MKNNQQKSFNNLNINVIKTGPQTPVQPTEFLTAEAMFIMEKKAQKIRSYSSNPADPTNSINNLNQRVFIDYSHQNKEVIISSLLKNYSKETPKVFNSKVMFKDEKYNEPFISVIKVESYKKYNATNTFILSSNKKPSISACCIIW